MTDAARRTVLVVDDDPAMRRFLETLLTHRGWLTRGAATGAEALAQLRAPATGDAGTAIDVLLLDAMLPDVRGYDLARTLIGDARTASLPICFLSGALSGRARPVAGVGCILKPAMPQQVMATLEEVIGSAAATTEARLEAIDAIERLSFL